MAGFRIGGVPREHPEVRLCFVAATGPVAESGVVHDRLIAEAGETGRILTGRKLRRSWHSLRETWALSSFFTEFQVQAVRNRFESASAIRKGLGL